MAEQVSIQEKLEVITRALGELALNLGWTMKDEPDGDDFWKVTYEWSKCWTSVQGQAIIHPLTTNTGSNQFQRPPQPPLQHQRVLPETPQAQRIPLHPQPPPHFSPLNGEQDDFYEEPQFQDQRIRLWHEEQEFEDPFMARVWNQIRRAEVMEEEDYEEPKWQRGREPKEKSATSSSQAMINFKLQLTPFEGKNDPEEWPEIISYLGEEGRYDLWFVWVPRWHEVEIGRDKVC